MRPTDDEIKEAAHAHLIKAGLSEDKIDFLFGPLNYTRQPASIRHHLNCVGGLVRHSVHVTDWMLKLQGSMVCTWMRPQSPYLIGMLHDLVKCYCYRPDKDSGGKFLWNPSPSRAGVVRASHAESAVRKTARRFRRRKTTSR